MKTGIPVSRSSYGNRYIRRDYSILAEQSSREEAGPEENLAKSYFEYHARRLLRVYMLSDANDLESVGTLVREVIVLAFKILLSRNKEDLKAADGIRVESNIVFEKESCPVRDGLTLGDSAKCRLSRSMVLGNASAEAVPTLDIRVELSVRQLRAFRRHPRTVRYLEDAFEAALPLTLDYRLTFSVRKEDWCFRLDHSRGRARGSKANPPALGITMVVGAG
ncbi:MAG: hypothetical protein V3V49_02995 [Candidatus Krumholzibacteria bacterium]